MKSYFRLNGFPGSLGSQTVAAWTILASRAIAGAANKEETTSVAPISPNFIIMGFSPLCRVTRLVFATPDTFGARANNAIRVLFQFVAQPAQIAMMATQTQVGAAGFSFPVIAGRQRE